MKNRKKSIALIVFLVITFTVIVNDQINVAKGDVKAPILLKQAVEAIIRANPEAGNRHLGWCGTPGGMHVSSFMIVFRLARTEDIIPFLEHRGEYVRQAVRGTLAKRGIKANRAIKRAYKRGSARIKLELLGYINPDATADEKLQLLNEIINNDKLKIFYSDARYLTPECRNNQYATLDGTPFDIIKFYLRMMETDFVPDKVIAISSLGGLGAIAALVVPVFIEILEGQNSDLYNSGASMMGYGRNDTLHTVVITALGDIGPAASEAVPLIESKLDTSVYSDKINIHTSLYKIGKDKEEHLSFILDEFNNQSPGENLRILISSISIIGSDASAALPKLIELAKTADRQFRNQARMAITSIEGSRDTAKKILLEGLKSEDPIFRAECVNDMRSMCNDPEIKAVLFEMCKDPDPDVKYQAVDALSSYGRERESLVPYIIEIINADPQGVNVQYAADKIRHFEEYDFSAALPGMLNLLSGQQDYQIRGNIKTILKIGGTYDDIVNKLCEFIKSEDEQIASSAMKQLGELEGKASAALLPLYKQYHTRGRYLDRDAKRAIQRIIRGINSDTDISPEILITILDSLDRDDLRKVVNKLTREGTDFEKIVPRLGEISRHGDTLQANEAMKILETHGGGSLSALPELAGKLDAKGDYQANLSIMNILKSVTSETKGDVKNILPVFWSSKDRTSHEAAKAVFRMTGSYDAAADELIKVLERGSQKQRRTAVKTLGHIGGGANKALPALKAELNKPDTVLKSDVKRAISSIMTTIEPDQNLALDELLDSLEVGSDQNIKDAANNLIKATGEYQAVIDRLGEIALSDDEQLRNRGFWALGGLETHQSEALLKLHELDLQSFQDRQGGAGYQIKKILQKIERGSDVVPEVILKVIESPNQSAVRHGTKAYITLTGNYEPVVDRLIELLYHDNQYVRANACHALAGLKGNAAKALPVLENLPKGDFEEYNIHRKYAIDEIKRGMR